MKHRITLKGNDLKQIIVESVKKVIKESLIDNENTLQCLKALSQNQTFVMMLKYGVIELRAEHYSDVYADDKDMTDQKIFHSIEEAAKFVNSSREQAHIYVDGINGCLHICDIV